MRIFVSSFRAQFQMTSRSIEDLMPLVTMPFFTLVFMAVFIHSGRRDLLSYGLVASMLMTVGQMGLFVASEVITRERFGQTLELLLATPAPFALVLVARILLISLFGLLGFAESWLIATLAFGVSLSIEHPWVFLAALLMTSFAATGAALISAALFCFSRDTRTFQSSLAFPLFLIGGVLVPVTFLPEWIQPLSRAVFLYWSAELLRDALQPDTPADVLLRLRALTGLGFAGGGLGAVLIQRMLLHLKREGTLGVT